jgi:gas vesicle protein
MNGEERGAGFRQRLAAFLFGGAVGLAAGLLLAPRSGREFRSDLVARAEDAAERGREVYHDVGERVQEKVSEVGERASYREEETPIVSAPEEREPRPRPARSEELLRKIEETRARLREQMDRDAGEGGER